MTLKHFYFFMLFITLIACQDQNGVSGHVYNMQQKAVDSVKVMVNGSDIYTYTNEAGYFEINTNDLNDELMFEKEGYQLKYQIFDDSTDNKIVLEK